jgi:tRNA (guanine-N7-)-methyltransferase
MNSDSTPESNTSRSPTKREIRSFVIRSGRMTESQKQALDKHLKRWSLNCDSLSAPLDFSSLYGNQHPVCLEIGFGMGDALYEMAAANPETNYLGIEVHTPGVGRLLRLVEENKLQNIRVIPDDAVKILRNHIAEKSLQRVNIFFPDPWHKKKHHKRRLIQDNFLTLLHSRLMSGGVLHIATDWAPYAEHVVETVKDNALFTFRNDNNPYVSASDYGRPETKFERRGKRLQHEICDMVFFAK